MQHQIVVTTTGRRFMLQFKGQDGAEQDQPGADCHRQPHIMALLCPQAQPVPPHSAWSEVTYSSNEVKFTPSVASPQFLFVP